MVEGIPCGHQKIATTETIIGDGAQISIYDRQQPSHGEDEPTNTNDGMQILPKPLKESNTHTEERIAEVNLPGNNNTMTANQNSKDEDEKKYKNN